jgi:hypothetical protein
MRIDLLIAAVLMLLATLAVVLRLRNLSSSIDSAFKRLETERDRAAKSRQEELLQLKKDLRVDIDALRSDLRKVPAETARLIPPPQTRTSAPPPPGTYDEPRGSDEPRGAEDGIAHLLSIANRLVRQSAATLEEFRSSAGAVAGHVSPWPNDGTPLAFIVEHRGVHYAVPNTVKPGRLPQEWFNRSDFGFNDEIRGVRSLPRLTRRGDRYEIQEPGVFER